MAIVSSKDLDAQMGKTIDPNSVPKHNGGSQGVMKGMIPNQSDHIEVQQGHGHRGAPVYDANEVPPKGFYGSSTIISVNDAPPLEAGLEPKPVPVPAMEKPVAHRPLVMPPMVTKAVPQPVQVVPAAPVRKLTASELIARMGPKPKA